MLSYRSAAVRYAAGMRRPAKITKKQLAQLGLRDPSVERDERMRALIRSIPRGKVVTYGQVAAAAGYPLYHRHVVRLLRKAGEGLPWFRVLGAGGLIKLPLDAGYEQRLRLESEGVKFRGKRVDLAAHQYQFKTWKLG
jgi:methylated-DNA-protein-cysteine methyltransferase-like protein